MKWGLLLGKEEENRKVARRLCVWHPSRYEIFKKPPLLGRSGLSPVSLSGNPSEEFGASQGGGGGGRGLQGGGKKKEKLVYQL